MKISEKENPAGNEKYIDLIIQASNRGAELTEKLLSYVRKEKITNSLIDTHLMIKETENILQHTLAHHIVVNSTLKAQDHVIECDASGLRTSF